MDDNDVRITEEAKSDSTPIKAEVIPSPGNVLGASVEKEMESRFLQYSMSVIVARALPDVRDGLKPVHRRILYTMHRKGVSSGGKTMKSAKIVGEVMGNYHPHGNAAIYDAMVRLAQSWIHNISPVSYTHLTLPTNSRV